MSPATESNAVFTLNPLLKGILLGCVAGVFGMIYLALSIAWIFEIVLVAVAGNNNDPQPVLYGTIMAFGAYYIVVAWIGGIRAGIFLVSDYKNACCFNRHSWWGKSWWSGIFAPCHSLLLTLAHLLTSLLCAAFYLRTLGTVGTYVYLCAPIPVYVFMTIVASMTRRHLQKVEEAERKAVEMRRDKTNQEEQKKKMQEYLKNVQKHEKRVQYQSSDDDSSEV